MATGVLVVAIGEATKLAPYLTAQDKRYEARIELGRETDTLDALGKVTAEAPVDASLIEALSRDPSGHPLLQAALVAERARTLQSPPAFSAIHTEGERAYDKARRGDVVTLADRPVRVHSLEVVGSGAHPRPFLDIAVTADKGYYVRSLGRDLARALGTVGHLTSLRRLASGSFTVDEAVSMTEPAESVRARLIPLEAAARRALPVVVLTGEGATRARVGKRVPASEMRGAEEGVTAAWLDEAGALVAVGVLEGEGRVRRGFSVG
jgi:tRNA pseudouridine55 synthase